MPREELSSHDHVRLLGHLALLVEGLPGDVVEIGVWKGKSLVLRLEVCHRERRIIGIATLSCPISLKSSVTTRTSCSETHWC